MKISGNAIITMHIPPGIGVYGGGSPSWRQDCNDAFIDIITQYNTKIVAIYSGHYHQGYFNFVGGVPVVFNPSLSPIFGNNPTFRYLNVSENNYYDYVLDSYNATNF
jgi:hypothetical protein